MLTGSRSTGTTFGLLVLTAGLFIGSHVHAEEEAAKSEESTEELTKKTQNPVADLISVPFQSNFNFGAGPRHALLYVLNVQPVVPIKLTEDWNLITRTIVPIISQGSLAPGIDHVGGDINPSLFLSPSKPGKLIWGVGPTMTFPTASDRLLGSGKWSMGPPTGPRRRGTSGPCLWAVAAASSGGWARSAFR